MIRSPSDIYSLVNKKLNLDNEALVKSIGNTIFQALRDKVDKPRKVAYELPKLGTFIARFNKMEMFNKAAQKRREENNNMYRLMLMRNPNIMDDLESLMKDIQDYREAKKTKRTQRYESKNNITEHKEVHAGMDEIHPLPPIIQEENTEQSDEFFTPSSFI